jgi:hypothetical protein
MLLLLTDALADNCAAAPRPETPVLKSTDMIRLTTAAPLMGAILAFSGAALAQTSFTPIPNASGQPGSNPNGCYVSSQPRVSADGSTVAFTSYIGGFSSGAVPFPDYAIWTQNGGTEVIAPGASWGANFGWGNWGLSGDGTLVCGSNWIWRRVGGYQSLESTLNPPPFPPFGYSAIFGCSEDGSVLVGLREEPGGNFNTGDYFRWQLGQGAPQILPRDPQHPDGYFIFNCISGDGSVVGGQTWRPDPALYQTFAAALVTPAGATLITPESAGNATLLRDLSFNGSVAVGQASLSGPLGGFGLSSFRWTAAGGLQVLPTPGTTSAAHACDSAGDTIVGSYLNFGTAGTRAYVWRAATGAIDLQDELTNTYGLGSALQGWTLLEANDVSGDGSVIVGVAKNPQGCDQVFVVRYGAAQFTCQPGIGGVLSCPCANPPSGANRGCNNSSSTGGATITAAGVAQLNNPTLRFITGAQTNGNSILLQGTSQVSTGLPFGQGVRCVAGSLKRLYVKSPGGTGGVTVPNGTNDPSIPARSASLGDVITPGSTRYYMVYYRDPNVLGGCDASTTFNTTPMAIVAWN